MKKAILFAGQGAQFRGMGEDLFQEYAQLAQQASEILGYDLVELCLKDPHQQLNLTQYTQPALYVYNALGFYKKQESEKLTPDFALGHSLGEYNALLVAKAFDFMTGLQLVQKRGKLMSQVSGGGMAAILGLRSESIVNIMEQEGLTTIQAANYNTPKQLVIAGPTDDLEKAMRVFINVGARVIPLPVSAAFHSSYMHSIQKDFEDFLGNFSFNKLTLPVIANATAKTYEDDKIAQNLSRQITAPVRWVDSIKYLMNLGEKVEYIEVNTKILRNMVAQIQKRE